MKLLKRRDFLLGFAFFGLLGLLNWDYVFGDVSSSAPEKTEKETPAPEPAVPEVDCDYVLENGLIVDGTGQPGFLGSIGIKGDSIVAVGDFAVLGECRRINAQGLVIAPGFIDLHTHTEDYWAAGGNGEMVLKQGVTTHIGGNCGSSVPSVGRYFDSLGQAAVNVGLFVGYKNLRAAVSDNEKKAIGPAELSRMKEIIAQGMKEGAFGLSVGLSYYPQYKASTEELIELCRVVKEYKGFYSTHIRDENDGVIPSVEEAIQIGTGAEIPVEYSHVKCAGKRNWGKMKKVLALLDQAVAGGLDITGDVYGYTYSSLDAAENNRKESMCEEDMVRALQHPLIMVGSDSGLNKKGGTSHPRAYGNYSRILSLYVRDKQVLTLEKVIHKMTLMPAKRLRLNDRGVIAPGKKADLAVFNLAAVEERATRQVPNQFSTGMKYVFVNGSLVLEQGVVSGIMAGRVLRNDWAG